MEVEYRWPNLPDKLEVVFGAKPLPRVFTPEELRAIWNSCEDDRDRGFVSVILDTGIRVGEVASMTKRSIGPRYLRVRGKTGDRQVPLSEDVELRLWNLNIMWKQWPATQRLCR